MAKTFFGKPLCIFRKQKRIWGRLAKIVDYELKIWEVFLKYPRFITPKSFLGNRINLEIYTDACAKSPFEKGAVNWTSGIGIGGILLLGGKVVEFFSLEVNKRTPHG